MDFVEKLSAADARLEARTNALRRSEATEEKVQFALRWGHVLIRKYPWIDSNLLERSSELVDTINNELIAYTNCMVVRGSPIGASVSSATTALNTKCLGYFATRDIRAREEIMYAPTVMSAHNRQMSGYCYNCPQGTNPHGIHVPLLPCDEILQQRMPRAGQGELPQHSVWQGLLWTLCVRKFGD